jgi:hypothetical protein
MNTNFSSQFAISLYDEKLRTVGVTYQHGTTTKEYVYKTHLELNEGDLVICPVKTEGSVNYAYVIGKVTAVHDDIQIPKDSTLEYKWIVQKVDFAAHEAAAARDAELLKTFATYQRGVARIALAKELEEVAPGLGDTMRAAFGKLGDGGKTIEVEEVKQA